MYLSVVAGAFNEAENISEFVERTLLAVKSIPDCQAEIIIIDNASTDQTPALLRSLAAIHPELKVILNSRNFGHIRSPYHALLQANGDCAVCLASDLQDPPELIPQLVTQWREGFKTVVCVKEGHSEGLAFSVIRNIYYRCIYRLSGKNLINDFTGFGLYDKVIIDYCRGIKDPYPYFRGLISEIGFPIARIPFRKSVRRRGITKNNFYTLYDLAMLGFTNHSKVPLRLAAMLGFCMSFVSLLVGVVYLIYKLLFWDQFSVGVAPVVIGLFFFSSVQLFFIGILGEYIGAIHTQVLHRPLVVEKERINF